MRFTYLTCEDHKDKHPGLCLFTNPQNTVYCTAITKCGIRLGKKKKGMRR